MRTTHLIKNLLFIALLTFVGCMDNNVYNPDNKKDNGEVTDLTIPTDFPWSTTSKVAVNVSTGSNTNHIYTISIYPQSADKGSLPLAVGTSDKNNPFRDEIIVPSGDTIVAVTQTLRYTDGSRMTLQCNAPIVNKRVTLNLGETDNTNISNRSLAASTRSDYSDDWKKAKELTDDTNKIGKEEIYKVSAGKTTKLPDNINIMEKAKIYIAGTLVIPEKHSLNKDAEFIVLSKKQAGSEEAGFIICLGNLTIENGFDIDNYGTIHVEQGTLFIKNGSEIDNHGCIFANRIELDGNGKKDDDDDDDDYELLDMEEGGYAFAKTMWMQKATVEMDENSLLEVEGTLEFKDNCKIIGDKDHKWAVVKIGNAIAQKTKTNDNKNLKIEKKVFVVCDYNDGDQPDAVTRVNDAQWGNTKAAANAGVKTTGSDCAPAFVPKDDGDPEPPIDDKDISLGKYTYAFEDLWPNFGDYDMNDLVLITEAALHIKDGYVTQATLRCKLAAIGATKHIAAAVQLDALTADNISNIEYNTGNNFTESLFSTQSNGTEQGQKFAVIPLFDHAHAFAGLNSTSIAGTYKNVPFDPKEFTVTIYFKNNSVEESKLRLDQWNYFITCNASPGKRMEIHQINGKATDLFDTSLIGGVVSSPGTPFRAEGNFCWAMQIPGEFRFPLENNNIRQSFEDFDSWITKPEYDWYNHPIPEKVK